MPILIVTDNTTVQNSGTVDEQYTGSAVSRLYQSDADYNYSDAADSAGIGNFSADNSNTVITFSGLSNLPVGAEILSASLYFYTGGGFGSMPTVARQILRAIDITEVTWNSWTTGNAWTTPGGDGSGDSAAPSSAGVTVTDGSVYYSIDVTDDVQAISDETLSNYGWILQVTPQDSGTGFRFLAKQTNTDATRPELVISYNAVPQPSIDGVAGTWRPGNSLVITTANLGTITSATLGGEALTITATDTDEVTVTVPTDIALEWGVATYTLSVGDGTDTADQENITLLARTGWEYVNYAGPEPDAETTEGFYEYAEVYRTFSAAVGDQLQFTTSSGLTIDTDWLPTVSPADTVTGTYAIFDVSAGTRLEEDPYTIRDSEVVLEGNYFESLGSLGYTGPTSQRQHDYLVAQGFSGATSSMAVEHLQALGYTGGVLSELLKQKADAEGYLSVSAMMKSTGLIG